MHKIDKTTNCLKKIKSFKVLVLGFKIYFINAKENFNKIKQKFLKPKMDKENDIFS